MTTIARSLTLLFATTALAASPDGPLPWIAGDYAAAIARGKAERKPVVIDFWAPWCHTCRSMQHTVLTEGEIVAKAGDFVWLSLDTDAPTADAVVARYPIEAWPTFLIVDPFAESVQARHVGSASTAQFRAFLEEGARAFGDSNGHAKKLSKREPLRLMRLGDQAAQRRDHAAAAKAYRDALGVAPKGWPGRPAARVALVSAWLASERASDCVDFGLTEPVDAADGPPAPDFIAIVTECAAALPEEDPRRSKWNRSAEQALTRIVSDDSAPLTPDDRGDAMRILRDLRMTLGDDVGAAAIAERALTLLDAAAAARPPAEAATFNMARVDVYTFLGRGDALVPSLTANVAALPDQYDPPYRLAQLHLALKRPSDALAAANTALARVRGARTRRVLMLLVDIQTALGDAAALEAARAALAAFDAAHPPKK